MTTNDAEGIEKETTTPQLKRAKDFAEEFGGTIRHLNTAQGISFRTFAAKVDFSPAYLSKIERGEFSPPGEQKIIALARELKQDPEAGHWLGGFSQFHFGRYILLAIQWPHTSERHRLENSAISAARRFRNFGQAH